MKGYKSVITTTMQTAARVVSSDTRTNKLLLNAAELLANVSAILRAHDEHTVLSREEFLATTYLLEMVDNNLHRLPLDFLTALGAEKYTTTSGAHKTNINLTRNNTAHILNLEHFVTMHESSALRAQWLNEFFAKGKLFDVLLNSLEFNGVVADKEIFTLEPVILVAEDQRGPAGAGAGAGIVYSINELVEKYGAALPILLDHTAGKSGTIVEAAFVDHQDSLLKLLNYHIQLATQSQSSASDSIVSMSEFIHATQVVGNISKILHITGGMNDELSHHVEFLRFVRNDMAHARSVQTIEHYTNSRYLSSAEVGRTLSNAARELSDIALDEVASLAAEIEEVKVTAQDTDLMRMMLFSAETKGNGSTKTQKQQEATAADKAAQEQALEEMLAKMTAARGDIDSSDSDSDDAELTLREKFDAATEAQKNAQQELADQTFSLVQQLVTMHSAIQTFKTTGKVGEALALVRQLPELKSQLEDLLINPDFDINTTSKVAYTQPTFNRRQKRIEVKKIQEQRDLELLEKIVRGDDIVKATNTYADKIIEILPLNALMLLIKETSTGTTSKYYAMVKAVCDSQSLQMEYVQKLGNGASFTNPFLTQSLTTYSTLNNQLIIEYSKALYKKYQGAFLDAESIEFKYFDQDEFISVISVFAEDLDFFTHFARDASPALNAVQLHNASLVGCLEIVEYLVVEKKVDVNLEAQGPSPLCIAARNDYTDMVALLLEHGADVNQANGDGCTPILLAAQKGHTSVVEFLVNHSKIKVNQVNDDGSPPLCFAAQNGHTDVVELLLAHKHIQVNQAADDGFTPLCFAAQNGHTDAVELLLERKDITIDAADMQDATALILATQCGHTDVVELLVAHGAGVNHCTGIGTSPLLMAAVNGDKDVVELLVAHGADVKHVAATGTTALHLAVENRHADVVELLLTHGADVNKLNGHGATPLCFTAYMGYKDVVEILVKNHDLDVCKVDGCNVTALERAVEAGHTDIVEILSDVPGFLARCKVEQAPYDNSGLTQEQIDEAQWDEAIDRITKCDVMVDVTGTDTYKFIQYLKGMDLPHHAPTYDELIEMAGEMGIEIM